MLLKMESIESSLSIVQTEIEVSLAYWGLVRSYLIVFKQAVSKELSMLQEKLSNPEQYWGALSTFEKGLYNNDSSRWWQDEKAALQQKETALHNEKAALQQQKTALFNLQLEEKKSCT